MSLVDGRVEDGVGVVELRRPQRHNSLIPELLDDLLAAYRGVVAGGARAGVLAAAGRTFSTGGDLTGIRGAADRVGYSALLVGRLNETILEMAFGPIPMVAAVHGMVTGGSLGLVLACDHVVMGSTATIRPWYATVGFAPDGGWTALLPGVVGRRRAASLLYADATITADEALAWGLAHEVAETGAVLDRAMETARRIASGVPGAVGAIRRLTSADRAGVAARLEAERTAFLAQVGTAEATEGMDRFIRGESR